MRGIGGLLRLDDRPLEQAHLQAMSAALRRRAPGDEWLWTQVPVGLFERSASRRQNPSPPSVTPAITVVADARLDNAPELRRELGLYPAAEDHEIIAAAYRRWGDACAVRLLGDFAFALWDGARRRLFCARDAFGVRPFCFHYEPTRMFAFGSEIKALLAVPDVPRRLDEQCLADYLAGIMGDRRQTFYQAVERLPAAHCLVVDGSTRRAWPYWDPGSAPGLAPTSEVECEERFRRLFQIAVERRVPPGEPLGAMLSGGLDSSSIACMARRVTPGSVAVHTFSAIFPSLPACDEQTYMRAVTATQAVVPHFISVDQVSPLEDIEEVLSIQDEPFHAPNLFIHRALYRAAADQGIRVVLDGFDGDTTVSHGLAYLTELFLSGSWGQLTHEFRALHARLGFSYWRMLMVRCVRPLLPPRVLLPRVGTKAAAAMRTDILQPEFVRRTGLRDRMTAHAAEGAWSPRTEREAHLAALGAGLQQLLLETADRAAARFGLEPRYPFYDRELAEFCVSLPGRQKLRNGWTRWIMRASLKGILPEEIRWRPGKSDLTPGFKQGMTDNERERVDLVLRESADRLGRYVDPYAMRALVERFRSGAQGAEPLVLWNLTTLALWLRQSPICS